MTTLKRRASRRTPKLIDPFDITTADIEPTAAELAAIDDEWPLIKAELELLDAQLSALIIGQHLDELGRRRIRRAEDKVMREAAAHTLRTRQRGKRRRSA